MSVEIPFLAVPAPTLNLTAITTEWFAGVPVPTLKTPSCFEPNLSGHATLEENQRRAVQSVSSRGVYDAGPRRPTERRKGDPMTRRRCDLRHNPLLDIATAMAPTPPMRSAIRVERGAGRMSFALICLCISVGAATLLAPAAAAPAPLVGDEPPQKKSVKTPKNGKYVKKSWSKAFEKFHARISEEYPFTEWRGIDWDAMQATTANEISAAEAACDTNAYYLALRRYVTSIPDGHVHFSGNGAASKADVGGGFGFVVAPLNDDRAIAYKVWPGSPADLAGIQTGAEIVQWNGVDTDLAVAQVSVLWAEQIPGIATNKRVEQFRFLVRAPIGTQVDVAFRNPRSVVTDTVSLTAVDDDKQTLKFTDHWQFPSGFHAEILPSGFGYVRVLEIGGILRKKLGKALQKFNKNDVTGVIFDLRGNDGGSDRAAADMTAFFYTEPAFYEHAIYYDRKDKEFLFEPSSTETIKPGKIHFAGPVVVLVNAGTISSGEGVAYRIQQLPSGYVMGFDTTNGAFGFTDVHIKLPEGYVVGYPFGRTVDECFDVLIDSDADGLGGVVPDLLVERTEARMLALGQGEDVLLAEAQAFLAGL